LQRPDLKNKLSSLVLRHVQQIHRAEPTARAASSPTRLARCCDVKRSSSAAIRSISERSRLELEVALLAAWLADPERIEFEAAAGLSRVRLTLFHLAFAAIRGLPRPLLGAIAAFSPA